MHGMVLASFIAFLVAASLIFTGLIVWLGLKRDRESQASELDLRRSVLDKFASAEDFVRFMESANGRQFLEAFGGRQKSIRRKILGSISSGLVLLMAGVGFTALAWLNADRDMLIPGFLAGAIGIGLLLSAAISYRLSRFWRLLDGDGEHQPPVDSLSA